MDTDKYLLQLHDGTTVKKTLMEMDELADSPANKTESVADPSFPTVNGIPVWLQHNCKVTYDHAGEFHKSFFMMGDDGNMRFSCRRQKSAKREVWGQVIPNFARDWPRLIADHIIQPSWNASSFLRPTTEEKRQAALASALFPVSASHTGSSAA